MDTCARHDRPFAGPEKPMLEAFLDWQRATLLCKIAGLSDQDLRRRHVPSGLTLLGIVKHLADVERSWFRDVFAGEDLSRTRAPDDPDRYWRIEPDETTDEVVAFYEGEVECARRSSGTPIWMTLLAVPDLISPVLRCAGSCFT